MTAARETLLNLHACQAALDWVGERDPGTAWVQCPRGDWLLWYAGKAGSDPRQIVRAACACARLVLHLVPAGDDRPRLAIEAAERWANDPTRENRTDAGWAAKGIEAAEDARAEAAAWAATDAAETAAESATHFAVIAASEAAETARTAKSAAEWAAETAVCSARAAAWATVAAAGAAHAADALTDMHRQCAEAVRALIPFPGLPPAVVNP